MNFPQKINLNFVDYMKIEQNFDRAEDGTRQLLNESITTEFKLVDNSDGIYAKRDVYYRNYQYEPDDKALQAFRKPEKVIEEADKYLADVTKRLSVFSAEDVGMPTARWRSARKRLRWTR